MKIEVTLRGELVIEPAYEGEVFDHDTEVERAFDETMSELVALGVEEPSVTGSLATGTLEVVVTVEADSVVEAIQKADSTIRAAFHGAGVHTPGWKPRLRMEWVHAEAGVPAYV